MGFQRSCAMVLLFSLSILSMGCGGFKGVVTPTLSTISPRTIAAGGAGFTLTVSGTNFTSGTKVLWDGFAQATTVVSNTQLTTSISAAQIASPGTINIGVVKADTTSSNILPLTITGSGTGPGTGPTTPPTLTSLDPPTSVAGSGSLTLNATGTNFVTGAKIVWDGIAQAATFVSNTRLTTTISAAQVATADSVTVAVVNPDSTVSNFLTFIISANLAVSPTLTSITPNTIAVLPAGSADVTITLLGLNFDNAAVVQSTNSAKTTNLVTTFISPTQLTAVFPATSLAEIGQFQINVFNPNPTPGRLSNPLPLNVGIVTYFGEVKDVAWDQKNNLFYASVPSESGKSPNTIAAITPAGKVTSYSVPGGDPDRLSISSDGLFLYVGLDAKGSVARYALPFTPAIPTPTPALTVPLGLDSGGLPYYALDLQVAPNSSRTIAVARGSKAAIVQAQGGVAVYDDNQQRGTAVTPAIQSGVVLDTIQWNDTASALYAANNETSGGDFYQLDVSASGVTFRGDQADYFPRPNIRIHLDAGLLYGDDGVVVEPLKPTKLPQPFVINGIMVPDSGRGLAYFLGQPDTQAQNGTVSYVLQSVDLAITHVINSIPLYNIAGAPQHLIHWSETGTNGTTNGLAFSTTKIAPTCAIKPCNTSDGGLYILSGPFVTKTGP